MSQLIDDHLAPDPLSLRRISSFLAKEGGSAGALAARITRRSANGVDRLTGLRPGAGRARRLQTVVDAAVQRLADLVANDLAALAETSPIDELRHSCELLPAMRLPRALREDIARLPACFRSFDQHPDDLRRLAGEFAVAHPDRLQPLLIIGIRTSGSYLAPLYAAYLRADGYGEVSTITMRPERRPGTAGAGADTRTRVPRGTGAGLRRPAGDRQLDRPGRNGARAFRYPAPEHRPAARAVPRDGGAPARSRGLRVGSPELRRLVDSRTARPRRGARYGRAPARSRSRAGGG